MGRFPFLLYCFIVEIACRTYMYCIAVADDDLDFRQHLGFHLQPKLLRNSHCILDVSIYMAVFIIVNNHTCHR